MPISPDSDYSMCGAVSCLHITPDIYHGTFIGQLDVDGICDNAGYLTFGERIERAVLQWWPTASLEQRAYATVHGFLDLPTQIAEATGTVISCLATAHMKTTTLEVPTMERMVHSKEINLVGLPYTEAIGLLIEDWKIEQWAWKLNEQYVRLCEVLKNFHNKEELSVALDSLRQVRYGSTHNDYDYRDQCTPDQCTPSFRSMISKRDRRRTRRAINRGINSFNKFFGSRDINAFISHKRVKIDGIRYDYHLTNHNNIIERTLQPGHGVPYGLDICDKQGEKLASACVFLPATPIIDQILALALNVKDGESEIEFLQRANLSYVGPNIELAGVPRIIAKVSDPSAGRIEPTCTPDEWWNERFTSTIWYEERSRITAEITIRWRRYIEDCIREISGIPYRAFDTIRHEIEWSPGQNHQIMTMQRTQQLLESIHLL